MTIYIVWDNDDYGSTFSPSSDEIDSAFYDKKDADARVDHLNDGRQSWRTKARVAPQEVK